MCTVKVQLVYMCYTVLYDVENIRMIYNILNTLHAGAQRKTKNGHLSHVAYHRYINNNMLNEKLNVLLVNIY